MYSYTSKYTNFENKNHRNCCFGTCVKIFDSKITHYMVTLFVMLNLISQTLILPCRFLLMSGHFGKCLNKFYLVLICMQALFSDHVMSTELVIISICPYNNSKLCYVLSTQLMLIQTHDSVNCCSYNIMFTSTCVAICGRMSL